MLIIWFNSEEIVYEIGTQGDYHVSNEYHGMIFEVLYEFNLYNKKIAQRVVNSLNAARLEAIAV